MKLLGRKAEVPLDDRLAALAEAADLAEGRLGAALVERARAVVARAGVRRSLSVEHTAVALAGATGSGKSSLFNALTGADLAEVGVVRPTTARAQAAVWHPASAGSGGAGPLLDWLGIPLRHTVTDAGGPAREPGLILLDLPDHDSIEFSHRLEVDRLVGVVDLLVWVLDPQKYADAAVHDRYLRPLARHRDVMVVVLNQIDRLPRRSVSRCLDDLRRLLAADGLRDVPVLGVSARTGQGVDELRAVLDRQVSRRRAWASRLAADAATAAGALAGVSALGDGRGPGDGTALGDGTGLGDGTIRGGTGPDTGPAKAGGLEAPGNRQPTPEPGRASERALARALERALERAASVPIVVDAVAKAHRHRSIAATGWPVTRWVRRLRPDPLRRLRLLGSAETRTSLPPATAVQVSAMEVAVRDVGAAAADAVPEPWASSVRHAARARTAELADVLDRVVSTASVGVTRAPRWWRAAGVLQWLLAAAMTVGALWLLTLFVLDYLMLPRPSPPTLDRVPWPTVLLVGGAATGVFVALLCRAAAWLGGRRRARKAAKALRAGIQQVGNELVIRPATAEVARYGRFVERVAVAGGSS